MVHILPSKPNPLRHKRKKRGDRSAARLKCSRSSESSSGSAESHDREGILVAPLDDEIAKHRQFPRHCALSSSELTDVERF